MPLQLVYSLLKRFKSLFRVGTLVSARPREQAQRRATGVKANKQDRSNRKSKLKQDAAQ